MGIGDFLVHDLLPAGAGLITGFASGSPAIGLATYGAVKGLSNAGGDEFTDAPAGPGPAPQIDPNAGIGYGLGYMNQGDIYRQKQMQTRDAGLDAQINALASQYRPIDPNDPASIAHNAQIQEQIGQLTSQKGQGGPDMSDPGRYAAMAMDARGQQAPQVGHVGINPNSGVPDYMNYQQDRSQLGGVADAIRQRALGQGGPSVAQLQLQQGRDASMANAMSIANSQRGSSGSLGTIEALRAQQNTMGQYNQQAAMLRAQEQMGAQGMYGNLMNAQQAQDLASRGQSFGQDYQRSQFDLGQGQFNAGLTMQQQGLNNGREMGMLGMYQDARHMQQGNSQFNANLQAGNQGLGLQAQQVGQGQQRIDMDRDAVRRQQENAWLSAGATGLAQYATSKPSAPTGPTPNGGNTANTQPGADGVYNPWSSGGAGANGIQNPWGNT